MKNYDLCEKGKFDKQGRQHILCEVVEFDDGQVIAKWCGAIRSLVIHKTIEDFKQISLNNDRVLFQYDNEVLDYIVVS
jgi:hypothetical protein